MRTTSTYDAANQQLLDVSPTGRTTYGYDNAGNRTLLDAPAASTYYTWDVLSRLTQANPIAGPVTLTYDGDNRRVRRETPTQTRRFVFDFEKVLQDTDDSGLTEKQYASTEEVYGDLLSAYDGGAPRYFAYDGLGSTDALLAPDGSVPDQWVYRAFGLESHTTGSDDNRFTWVGKQGYYDDREEGLYFLRARYYDPAAARFLSPDPDGFGAGDANLYRYAFNDPVNLTDPSGRRVLVSPCDTSSGGKSDEGLALNLTIQRDFGPQFAARNLRVGDTVDVLGNKYGVLDLFDALPAETWGLLAENRRGYPWAAKLNTALSSDWVLGGHVENGVPSALTWQQPKESFLHWLGRLIGQAVDVAATILQAGSRWVSNIINRLLQAVKDLVLAGLAALLKAAKPHFLVSQLFPNFDPDTFVSLLNRFRRVGDVAAQIVKHPIETAKTFGGGVLQGFKDFFDPSWKHLYCHIQNIFFDWLFQRVAPGRRAGAGHPGAAADGAFGPGRHRPGRDGTDGGSCLGLGG